MDYSHLKRFHQNVWKLYRKERERQASTLDLIPSENLVSQAVLEALGTEFTNKYAEGLPKARYYAGNAVVDALESYVQSLALKTFKLSSVHWDVNVQPYSGSPANLAVYLALLAPGERALGMSLSHGGHLTHGHTVSASGKLWQFSHYGVQKDGFIDYEEVERIARKVRPRLIVAGHSAYPRKLDFRKFRTIANRVGAYLLADVSHIAGLIAGGVHPSPFPYADVVTTTTHKTLRGPRGALLFMKKALAEKLHRAVFPGLQGGPHVNTIAAMAVCLEEARTIAFKRYALQVVKNAKTLASALRAKGFSVVSGGTDNHLLLLDVASGGLSGAKASEKLERAGIIVNKNVIPFDTRKPKDPSGVRLGTPALTTRGFKERDMERVAKWIQEVLSGKQSPGAVAREIRVYLKKYPMP